MGKSDPMVYDIYYKSLNDICGGNLANIEFKNIGFFGQAKDNDFTAKIKSENRKFYDLTLKNWNINSFPYNIEEKFDLIVCTRCAYFCKDPKKLFAEFNEVLLPGGKILIDWGLGDHWRFENYKVGWVKDKEQEWAYEEGNYLWSTVWHKIFENDPNVLLFKELIENHGYNVEKLSNVNPENTLQKIIEKEVPSVMMLNELNESQVFKNINCCITTLWADSPQLYIVLVVTKER